MSRNYDSIFNAILRSSDWVDIYNMFKNIYLSSYKWVNLPDTINVRFLNLLLFEQGRAVFFKDEDFGFLTLQVGGLRNFDVYGEPYAVEAVGFNGYRVGNLKNNNDCVIIYDNMTMTTPSKRLELFARRIAETERTIDVNINAQKTPILLKTDKKQELTIRNAYKEFTGEKPVIVVDKSFNDESFKVIKTDAPFIADKLQMHKKQVISEALAYLGVENNSSEKRERLTAGEVMVSNGLAYANKNASLYTRKIYVEKINKIFNLNIEVEMQNLFFKLDGGGDEIE